MAAAAAAAVAHLSVHGRLRRSLEHRPSLLRCRAFKQEADGGDRDSDPSEPDARKRRKGPLYKLKAAIQGLAGSRSAAAEVYGGEHQYQRAVEKAEEIFFSVSTAPHPHRPPFSNPCAVAHAHCAYLFAALSHPITVLGSVSPVARFACALPGRL
jgi:hypothetical protein